MFQRTSIFGIKTSNDFEVSVECAFNDTLTTATDANISTSNVVAQGSQGHGNFAIDASFYTDEKYTTKSPETDIIIPGEKVFFGIKSSNAIEGISFYVNHCSVNDDFGNLFSIVDESCGATSTNTRINNFLSEDQITLQYTSFIFNSK